MTGRPDWLVVTRGAAPLIVSIPHAGIDLGAYEKRFVDPWLARKDADWRIDELYDFVEALDATLVRTRSRARSSTSIAIPPAPRSIPARRRPNSVRPPPSTASRSIGRAMRPTTQKSPSGCWLAFDPYHDALRSRNRSAPRAVRTRRAVRRPFDPLAHSAVVRRRAAGVQSRHEFRLELQPRAARGGRRGARSERRKLSDRRALQGRLDHPQLR